VADAASVRVNDADSIVHVGASALFASMTDPDHPHPPPAFPENLSLMLRRATIAAVLVIDEAADAVPLAEALTAGGVTAMELTLRTPAALESLSQIRRTAPDMIIGAGTVINATQITQCIDAGADFAVAPGFNRSVVDAAREGGLPFAPGVCTPTEIEMANECGCRLLKFFPAERCGGLDYLKTINAPYDHLGLRYIPLGGIGFSNARRYLAEPIVQCVGGSWVAPRELIRDHNWEAITSNARRATELAKNVRHGGTP